MAGLGTRASKSRRLTLAPAVLVFGTACGGILSSDANDSEAGAPDVHEAGAGVDAQAFDATLDVAPTPQEASVGDAKGDEPTDAGEPAVDAAPSPTMLASTPYAGPIAVDSTDVYWMTGDTIYKCSINGCNMTPTVLATNQLGSCALAINGTSVFWTDDTSGRLMRCDKSGCGQSPTVLGNTYFSDTCSVAADSTNVYWGSNWYSNISGSLLECSVDGCSIRETVLVSGVDEVTQIAVDSTDVYWNDIGGLIQPEIGSCGLDGCDGGRVIAQSGLDHVAGFGIDSNSIYMADFWANAILKCPIGGCDDAGPQIIAKGQGAPVNVVSDGANIYWTNQNGTVMKCGTNCNNDAVVLASGQQPFGIAVDSTSVYWTDRGSGNVMKLTPK